MAPQLIKKTGMARCATLSTHIVLLVQHLLNYTQGFKPGESVAVFGAGPVGLMAAYSAVLRGASEVYVIDRVPERLAKAKDIGCIPIDFGKSDAVVQILDLRGG